MATARKSHKRYKKSTHSGVNIKEFFEPIYRVVDLTEDVNKSVSLEDLKPVEFWYELENKYQHLLATLQEAKIARIERGELLEVPDTRRYLVLSCGEMESLFIAEAGEDRPNFIPVMIHKPLKPSDVHPFLFGLVSAIKGFGIRDFGVATSDMFRYISVFAFRPPSIGRLAIVGRMFFSDKVLEKFGGGGDEKTAIKRFIEFLEKSNTYDFASLVALLYGKGDVLCLECGAPIYTSPKRGFCCEGHRNRLKARYFVRRKEDKTLPELKDVVKDYLERIKKGTDPKDAWTEIREEYGLNPKRRGRKKKR